MSEKKLMVVVNGSPILEFDRGKALPGHQRQYLDSMDEKMEAGVMLSGESITEPNVLQKAQFVANSMVNALLEENDTLAAAMCTYLAKRIPDLEQVQAKNTDDSGMSIELVFDRSYEKTMQEQVITFDPKLDS